MAGSLDGTCASRARAAGTVGPRPRRTRRRISPPPSSRTDMARFGILTGGGDAPALNAVIRAVVRRAIPRGHTVTGIRHGWKGLIEKESAPLDLASVSGILHRGGTILGTSRTNPYRSSEDERRLKENLRALGLDALIAC